MLQSGATAGLTAQDHLVRYFGADHGLLPADVRGLYQDPAGLLWIGTTAGMYRYDGREMRRWAGTALNGIVGLIRGGPSGTIIVGQSGAGEEFSLFRLGAGSALPLPGPDGAPLTDAFDAQVDSAGRLWVLQRSMLRRQDRAGAWSAFPLTTLDAGVPVVLRQHGADGLLLGTTQGLWRVTSTGGVEPLARGFYVVDALTTPDGRIIVLTAAREVLEVRPDGVRRLFDPRPHGISPLVRPITLVARDGVLWIALDRFLIRLGPDGAASITGTRQGLPGGGPLLVDQEGALWLGTFTGLYQYPEPETEIWSDRHGLLSTHSRFLVPMGDTIWVSGWQGLGLLHRVEGHWQVATFPEFATNRYVVLDQQHHLWSALDDGLVEIHGRRVTRHPMPGALYDAAAARGGGQWLMLSTGLVHLAPGGETRAVPLAPFRGLPPGPSAIHLEAGSITVSRGERVCQAPTSDSLMPDAPVWHCDSLPGTVAVHRFVRMTDGSLWAATRRGGVWTHQGAGWHPLPGGRSLGDALLNLVPSPRGGAWLLGGREIVRLVIAPETPEGWRVAERISAWQGAPVVAAEGLHEQRDGTLWLATSLGVVRIPPSARFTPLEPPRVLLVDARVDTQDVDLAEQVVLPYDQNRLELRFAAPSYRDPERLHYEVRLGADQPWVETRGAPAFRWVDLPAGRYEAQVRASLDGLRWSATPAVLRFRVAAPWYRTWPTLLLGVLLLAALAWVIIRARVAFLVGLEQQRTAIAMDLHDEIGSGLGSIGILAGVLHGGTAEPERGRIADEITVTAGELGTALSAIVWALDPRGSSLGELAARLAEQGTRLFPDERVAFTTAFPDQWPATRVSLAVRRSVLLIGTEALHNAARHAHATAVQLSLQTRGRGWELRIRDNGRGLPPIETRAPGRGLASMTRRAADIGAELSVEAATDGGTEVRLRFSDRTPSAAFRRPVG